MVPWVQQLSGLTAPFNPAGASCTAQPIPAAGSALPASLQLVGTPHSEELLISAAARVEQAMLAPTLAPTLVSTVPFSVSDFQAGGCQRVPDGWFQPPLPATHLLVRPTAHDEMHSRTPGFSIRPGAATPRLRDRARAPADTAASKPWPG